jgi:hypothetical protein
MIELGWAMGDFACNGLNYCSLNKVIIDMSGHGVQDCQGKPPILRIPYEEKQWETWMHLYHRWINLWRWFKFRARGQTGSSEEAKDKKFVVQQLIQHCTDEDLRKVFVTHISGEVKRRSDAEKMEYALTLQRVVCEDYVDAMGVDGESAAAWFVTSMLEWMPNWFQEPIEAAGLGKQASTDDEEVEPVPKVYPEGVSTVAGVAEDEGHSG